MSDFEEWVRIQKVKRQPRSVSQVNQYKKCPHSYYLQRVQRVWQRPAAWLPQGTAVHAAAEHVERNDRKLTLDQAVDVYEDSYVSEADAMLSKTPNLGWWFRSGPYDGQKDIERRYDIGRKQVAGYLDYYQAHPDERIWVAEDGTPAIELEFDIELGGIRVRGFIDQVVELPDRIVVRDIKTGNSPGESFQLGVYRVAMQKLYGLDIEYGDYWMADKFGSKPRKAGPTHPFKLDAWDEEHVTAEFQWLDEQINAERWDADPDPDKCNFCPVQNSCIYRM